MKKKMEHEMETLGPFERGIREFMGTLYPNNGDSNGEENGK